MLDREKKNQCHQVRAGCHIPTGSKNFTKGCDTYIFMWYRYFIFPVLVQKPSLTSMYFLYTKKHMRLLQFVIIPLSPHDFPFPNWSSLASVVFCGLPSLLLSLLPFSFSEDTLAAGHSFNGICTYRNLYYRKIKYSCFLFFFQVWRHVLKLKRDLQRIILII